MELSTLLFLIGLFLFYICNYESFSMENVTNVTGIQNLDINTLKRQDYIRYKSLIFGENPQFTNSILIKNEF